MIEVNEYVRTNSGLIFKVNEITYDEEYKDYLYKESFLLVDWKENIVKHSKQLIDLIEVGDYVNGREVKHIAMFEGFPDYPKLIFTDKKYLIPGETIENKDIKTIVTKEQMANIEYKVEEDKQYVKN